ncbi:hypothetical protein AX14_002983 [Amanita brunnescens Koide BX004]|nr:hypothetical protein AX14_002983 [Amanita brunnescens Koide BX004]
MLSVPYTKKDPVIVEDWRSVRLDNLGPYLSSSTTSRWCLSDLTRPGMTLALGA